MVSERRALLFARINPLSLQKEEDRRRNAVFSSLFNLYNVFHLIIETEGL